MSERWQAWVEQHLGSSRLLGNTRVQSLWGGYGELLRLHLQPGPDLILKRIQPPNSLIEVTSDRRKRRSYEVELAWYRGPASSSPAESRVARCVATDAGLLLLEDLQAEGFRPHRRPGAGEIAGGLNWLAHFHAHFLGQSPCSLWDQGTYWHLETRREEWERMPGGPFREAAEHLDARLREAEFQTIVHGDAKPANFLWTPSGRAAAVDFQYVGPGCGIRDVAYFLDGCLDEAGCAEQGEHWLSHYFTELGRALQARGAGALAVPLELEWRRLYSVAWCDFFRFWQGWGGASSAGSYTLDLLQQALSVPSRPKMGKPNRGR